MNDKIYTGSSLSAELNAQRHRKGQAEVPEINPCYLGNNTIARKDKSYGNIVGFYKNLLKDKDENGKTMWQAFLDAKIRSGPEWSLYMLRNLMYAVLGGFLGYFLHCQFAAYYIAINYFNSDIYKLLNKVFIVVLAFVIWTAANAIFERGLSKRLLKITLTVFTVFALLCTFAFSTPGYDSGLWMIDEADWFSALFVLNPAETIDQLAMLGRFGQFLPVIISVLLFVPIGAVAFGRKHWVWYGIGGALLVELLQVLLKRGQFATFDICLYLIGFALGALIKLALDKRAAKKEM